MEKWMRDLSFLEASSIELKDYLLSDQLYWSLSAAERLTLGNLLLSQKMISCLTLLSQDKIKFEKINEKIADVRSDWRSNWSRKAALEFQARLRQWDNFLREVLSRRENHGLIYFHEITWRVLLELLRTEIIAFPKAETLLLGQLDAKLRSISHPAGFLWDKELLAAFPEDRFWFLFVSI